MLLYSGCREAKEKDSLAPRSLIIPESEWTVRILCSLLDGIADVTSGFEDCLYDGERHDRLVSAREAAVLQPLSRVIHFCMG